LLLRGNVVLKMLTHIFRNLAHANTRKVIDCEPGVPWIILGKQSSKSILKEGILQAFCKFLHSHSFGQILEEDFNEDARGRGGVVFV
jgi:hypothetical protein